MIIFILFYYTFHHEGIYYDFIRLVIDKPISVIIVFTLLVDISQYLEIMKKFLIKNSNILKIFHSKFMEKIAFRNPMFQSRITIFLYNNKDTVLDGILRSYWWFWQHEH